MGVLAGADRHPQPGAERRLPPRQLHISEPSPSSRKDVNPAQGTPWVSKDDRRPAAFALLERWLDRRRALGLSGRRPVSCPLAGEPLDSSYSPPGGPSGGEKHVHPHGLRHAHVAYGGRPSCSAAAAYEGVRAIYIRRVSTRERGAGHNRLLAQRVTLLLDCPNYPSIRSRFGQERDYPAREYGSATMTAEVATN